MARPGTRTEEFPASAQPRCVWQAQAELGEGPLWIPHEQALYWVDILAAKLFRFEPSTGGRRCWRLPVQVSAIAPCEAGGLACIASSGVYRFDPVACKLVMLRESPFAGTRLRSNDGACDPQGNLWFGTMDSAELEPIGGFHRLSCPGELERIRGGMIITNGPAFDPERGLIYLVDTLQRVLLHGKLDERGGLGEVETFAHIPEAEGYPDGLAVDAAGGVWCAHWAGGRVTRFDADGHPDVIIRLPVPNVTKCAFGGRDLDTLFITTARKGLDEAARAAQPLAGGLFTLRTGFRGLAPAPFKPGFALASGPVLLAHPLEMPIDE